MRLKRGVSMRSSAEKSIPSVLAAQYAASCRDSEFTSLFSGLNVAAVAVGKGKILENGEVRPLDLKVGDKILFGKYSGTEVKMDGDELVVMREEDVMAVVEGK